GDRSRDRHPEHEQCELIVLALRDPGCHDDATGAAGNSGKRGDEQCKRPGEDPGRRRDEEPAQPDDARRRKDARRGRGEQGAGDLDLRARERVQSRASTASAGGRSMSRTSTANSGTTSRYDGPNSRPPACTFAIVASTSPSTRPEAIAYRGETNRIATAATRPFTPSS